ncbi:MAG: alanine--tRNA ligase [Clostridia bacterium]|nr:alanine--tRNA ligase [Clostridia bacterium]
MKWTGLNELREQYLSFFESKGHLRLPSFSLIPQNDKSLLLINSGMAPMKKYFTGEITPPRKRVTTCQKCIRTPDIENVGKTARHGTYFEMLGNFSFGDYFKHEATAWAWEFFTKVLELPIDRLWVTIYEDDDEAFEIWTKEVGVDPDRIVRMGKADNFWEHGSGPCGPCSEIHYDRGAEYSCGKPDCKLGCDCDRYMEVWNLVFTQFDSDGKGTYTPLDHPNIDTGMGLERLACVMQGVNNLFEVDTVQNVMKHISDIAGIPYHQNEKTDISLRVITDHIRSTTMMIGDGVMPSNEGRGYVLRRLLRRAARHGRLLGIERPFLSEVAATVIKENDAYPELKDKQEYIQKLIAVEEENFGRTIDQGLQMVNELIAEAKDGKISGEDAFRLYDTYGFPLDLTKDIAEEQGITVDEQAFTTLMQEQRKRARDARQNAGADAWAGGENPFEGLPATQFVGYQTLCTDGEILAIVAEGEKAGVLTEGKEGVIAANVTPFYGESGGQAGDRGKITVGDATFKVTNTTKNHDGIYLHSGVVTAGELQVGQTATLKVCSCSRNATARNHTAAHLLQAALREVLGTHVQQAGQMVDKDRMRFDFTHFSALAEEELQKVERLVNSYILNAMDVLVDEMPIEEAKKLGAMALFGEKYGDVVRVVRSGDVSIEFCGGTHVTNTSRIGLFHVVSESSVAAGVRRIEAVTGAKVMELLEELGSGVKQVAGVLKCSADVKAIAEKAKSVTAELKEKDREIERLQGQLAGGQLDSVLANGTEVNGVKVVVGVLEVDDANALRTACDKARDTDANVVALLLMVKDGKVTLCCACGKDAVAKGAHAGNLVCAAAAIVGGKGGGRPDSAMAGGSDVAKLEELLKAVPGLVAEQL